MDNMEFQVVLMAGGHGTRMPTLTHATPKALLPICNVPMVIYALKMLERHRFSTVILVARKSAAKDLRSGLDRHSVSLEIDLVTLPDDPESDMGTVESLRIVKDKIVKDFIVVSADLVTDFQLHHLADVHRLHDAAFSCLLKNMPEKSEAELLAMKAAKQKAMERGMVDFIGIDPDTSQIILFENEENLKDDESITMRKSVVHRHPKFRLHRDLLDAHLYIFAKWVIDFIAADKSISTIKGELIPFLVKKQFTNFKDPSPRSATLRQVLVKANRGGGDDVPKAIRCYGHVLPSTPGNDEHDVLCMRANTTLLYTEVNRAVIPRWHKLLNVTDLAKYPMIDRNVVLADEKKRKKQIGEGSMVDVGCKFGSNISIKRAIIGAHCTVGDDVTIADSIIMQHVTIGNGCTIKNSIISGDVHVGAKCSFDRVQVGRNHTIPDKTTEKNTQLTSGGLDATFDLTE
eukprot:m.19911 g.19911  ORF g.19911 m.19911 type:complete len:459 (+) comp3734_c0_seq1:246-1622(+)